MENEFNDDDVSIQVYQVALMTVERRTCTLLICFRTCLSSSVLIVS